jgi:hypothetical protein
MGDVLVWNGRVANAAPAKREACVAVSPPDRKTPRKQDALDVSQGQPPAIDAERRCIASIEEPRTT